MNRTAADFFARLANYADLQSIELWEKERLVAQVSKADLLSSDHSKWRRDRNQVAGPGLEKLYPGIFKSWSLDGKAPPPMAWLPIWLVHPFIRKVITTLLASKHADVRELYKHTVAPRSWVLDKDGKVIVEYDKFEYSDNELLIEFIALALSSEGFPFRRCELCKTIFVPASKKQKKFCTKECANKAVSLTPKRRKYMAEYMKERRSDGYK